MDVAVGTFVFFGCRPVEAALTGKFLSDGVGTKVDAAHKKFAAFLNEQRVGGFGAHVQHQRAAFELAVVVHEGVAQRRGRAVHNSQLQPKVVAHGGEAVDDVELQRHQHHFQFAGCCGPEDLIIPLHFVQREGDILLGLVLDDLPHLITFHRRGAQKFCKTLVAGRADVRLQPLGANLVPVERVLQHLLEQPYAVSFLQPALPQRHDFVAREHQTAARLGLEQRHFQARRTAINGQKWFHLKYSPDMARPTGFRPLSIKSGRMPRQHVKTM